MERRGWPARERRDQLVGADSGQVRDYLSEKGMLEDDIAKYLRMARDGGTAAFTFGPDEASAPKYTIRYADGSYQLTAEHPA
jgi:hypothetical protein